MLFRDPLSIRHAHLHFHTKGSEKEEHYSGPGALPPSPTPHLPPQKPTPS